MTTINALKNLYVELGGNIKDVENITIIPEMIDALSAIAGSTIELPGVTAEDNGDVLTVVDGKWAKAEAGGGASLPDVTAEDNGDVLTVVEGEWAKAKVNETALKLKWTITGSTYTTSLSGSELNNAVQSKVVEIYDETNSRNYKFYKKLDVELIFISLYPLTDHIEINVIKYNINSQNGLHTLHSIDYTV